MAGEHPRRYTIFLKDGRTPSVIGTRVDPNVDRLYQSQLRAFLIVMTDEMETAVFLASDVLGWTVSEDLVAERGTPAPPRATIGRTGERRDDSLKAILDS